MTKQTERIAVSVPQSGDAELLSRLRMGDVEALETLYLRYSGYVYALALRVLANGQEAEEATQDVFWRLWKGQLEYRPERGRFSTWLFAVTRNRAVDALRRAGRRPSTQPLSGEAPDDATDSPEETAYLGERRRQLATALGELPSAQRQALELCYFSGMTHREVAHELGEPLGTVKSRIKLGMAKIRQSLEGLESTSR